MGIKWVLIFIDRYAIPLDSKALKIKTIVWEK
jgi:hypothetical protein